MNSKTQGFTLIELVIVITIIGILSAIALPKFAALQTEARIAKMNGALGAMKSAAAMAHANLIARGNPANYTGNPSGAADVNMEGADVNFVGGYPDATDIALISGITEPDYATASIGTGSGGRKTATIRSDISHNNCSIVYEEADPASTVNTQPTYTINLAITDCQ